VTEEEVAKLSMNLKGKTTAAYDDIPESLVKRCIQLIKKPLVHIYNASFNSGVFPDVWKTVKVIPLYQHFPNFFQVGTTFISQNVLRTTPFLSPLKANLSFF
jgi:hypothetical protein